MISCWARPHNGTSAKSSSWQPGSIHAPSGCPWPPDVVLYELDQREVLAYKDKTLRSARAEPACRRHVIGVDLREPWAPALLEAGFHADRPSVWLAECLTFYLDEPAVRGLFTDIATLAAPNDQLGTDFVSVAPPAVDAHIGSGPRTPRPF
jgi:methyltransferase (TIGR00027 family)